MCGYLFRRKIPPCAALFVHVRLLILDIAQKLFVKRAFLKAQKCNFSYIFLRFFQRCLVLGEAALAADLITALKLIQKTTPK